MINSKKILIVGGTGDIGKAISKKYPPEDSHIVGSRDIDLSSNKSIENFFINNKNRYEQFIFASGVNNPAPIKGSSFDDFNNTMQVNCSSVHFIFSKNYKCFKNLRSFVVIGSLYGTIARKNRAAYTSSKHALYGLVKSLAIELSPKCNVNMVSPGFIKTKLTIKNNTNTKLNKIASMIPQKKIGAPTDIANAVYFLTDKKSKYINGVNLFVDGGFSTGGFQNYIDE
jgi:3-oxoacyl-[acyl-carrier protein] reductase